MKTLKTTARGQITLRKEVLQHMGIQAGEKITVDLLPDNRVALRASQSSATIEGFLGMLAKKTNRTATIQEIKEAASQGWAGKL